MTDKNGVPYQLPTESWMEYNFRLTKLGIFVSWNPETTNNYQPENK